MENPSRCRLLPEGRSSLREEGDEDVVAAAAVFEAEVVVALVEVPRLMSRVETGLVPTALVAT